MFIQHIGATGLQNITDGDESYISCVEFTVYGFTGSMVPQCVQMTDGPTAGLLAAVPNYFNCGYVNANTGVSYTAGTAITADGRYIIDTTGAKFALNVTDAGDGDFYVYGKPLAGPAPSFAASGSGGAVTIADGADVALGSTTDTAVGDATGTLISHARMSAKAAAQGAVDNSTNSTFKAPVLSGTANAAAPTWTEGRQVPLSTDLAGNLRVITTASAGAADNSTNSTTKAPVLVGTANAAAPTWTEGRQVPGSTDLAGNLRTIPAATEVHLGGITGYTPAVSTTLTRPGDTTAYAINDSVNSSTSSPTALTFTSAVRTATGTGYITKARLVTSQSTCVAAFRLWLFSASTMTKTNDNTLFNVVYADNAIRLGYLDFPACATETGASVDCAFAMLDNIRYAVTGSGSALYGLLETKTAFTPANAQTFFIELTVDQN